MSKQEPIIKIENLSKQYRLGTIGTGTMSHDINRWWHKVRGKEDPYLKIGEANDRSQVGNSEYVWALKDINFEVQPGEILGIIGKNGAGKSTLLKLLSRVTAPTTGSITCHGRIASLLEVGTGFHPELTGRENIFLNGAILGMTKKEIESKFDEIVDFAGCANYIETPVKRYSSGMYVRLAFAVAAHLEPDILVVDEVLAVGDAEFQKKAIGKMKEVSKGQGRTVLFVSHNMESILNLCDNGIIMENGKSIFQGPIDAVVKKYLSRSKDAIQKIDTSKPHIKKLTLDRQILTETRTFELEIEFMSPYALELPNFGVVVKNKFQTPVFGTNAVMNPCDYVKQDFKAGTAKLIIKNLNLLPGEYSCDIFLNAKNSDQQLFENILEFETLNVTNLKSVKLPTQRIIGSYAVDASWSYS
jgi:lipopolysaccharide transport system ATP-binding protein